MSLNITQKKELLAAKQNEWKAIYDAIPSTADGLKKSTAEQAADLKNRMTEMNLLGDEIKVLADIEANKEVKNALGAVQVAEGTDLVSQASKLFTNANGKFAIQKDKEYEFKLSPQDMQTLINGEVKTTFTTSAGYPTATVRDGSYVNKITRPISMLDFVRVVPAGSSNAYMYESTFTNNTAESGENAALTESADAWTQATDTFVTVGTFLPITEEVLEDSAEVYDIIQNRLMFMLRQRLDGQILIGDGTGSNLTGFYAASGVQTQARGSDTSFEAIYKAIGKCNGASAYGNANVIVMTNADWYALSILKDSTGRFLLGDAGAGIPKVLFGLPVVTSDAMTADTGLVTDTNWSSLRLKHDIRIKVSDSHASNFISNVLVMKAEMRVALRHTRGAVSVKITDLVA